MEGEIRRKTNAWLRGSRTSEKGNDDSGATWNQLKPTRWTMYRGFSRSQKGGRTCRIGTKKAECIEHRISENWLICGQNSEMFSGERGTYLSNAQDYPHSPITETSKWTPEKQSWQKGYKACRSAQTTEPNSFQTTFIAVLPSTSTWCQLETCRNVQGTPAVWKNTVLHAPSNRKISVREEKKLEQKKKKDFLWLSIFFFLKASTCW